jgi:hypothetical protein
MTRKKPKRYYDAGDGKKYPLFEAPYNYPVTVYKSDCKKAVIGDPQQCLIALGACRDKLIESAFIGSGKDAYIIFKKTPLREAYALHFTINAQAARVRDYFDSQKAGTSQIITLSAITPGRTLAHRSILNKKRAAEIKAGAEKKKRGKPAVTRVMRLGLHHRPRAKIEKNIISVPPHAAAESARSASSDS